MNEHNSRTSHHCETVFVLAKMSKPMAVATWAFCIAAVVLPVVLLLLAPQVWIALLMAVILWAVLRFVWCFYRPVRFVISSEGLRIVWRWRAMLIPIDEITEVAEISKTDLGFVIRTCGAGGMWGGFGRFWSRKAGSMLVYASRSDGLVRITRSGGRPLVISPARPEEFAAKLQEVLAAREAIE